MIYAHGKSNHKASQYHFREVICNNCKKGHLVKIYRAPKQTMDKGVARNHNVTEVLTGLNSIDAGQPESDADSELPLFKIQDSTKSIYPITVDMEINGKILNMEVDTGAAISIILQIACIFQSTSQVCIPTSLNIHRGANRSRR